MASRFVMIQISRTGTGLFTNSAETMQKVEPGEPVAACLWPAALPRQG
jgi:hypothetical protein